MISESWSRISGQNFMYVSSTLPGSLGTSDETIRYGEAHYSYKIALKKFVEMFRAREFEIYDLERPEIFSAEQSISNLPRCPRSCVHLIFKPFEHIKLLKGAMNIACLAWEFSRIQTQEFVHRPLLPMEDYRIVAEAVDEIWTPCTYARDVMRQQGISNVRFVPAPIFLADKPHADQNRNVAKIMLTPLVMNGWIFDLTRHEQQVALRLEEVVENFYSGKVPKIYIMVFNPGDMRKNPGAAVRAFLEFNAEYPDSLLIIKFVWNNKHGSIQSIVDTFLRKRMGDLTYVNTRSVWLTDEILPDNLFRGLIGSADFYVCTSFCEGQNLPLLEAMFDGIVPLSVGHTAMADYINTENAVVIPSYRTSNEISISAAKEIVGAEWYAVEDSDMVQAYISAHTLSSKEYDAKSEAAARIVRHNYSFDAVTKLIAGT